MKKNNVTIKRIKLMMKIGIRTLMPVPERRKRENIRINENKLLELKHLVQIMNLVVGFQFDAL